MEEDDEIPPPPPPPRPADQVEVIGAVPQQEQLINAVAENEYNLIKWLDALTITIGNCHNS